MIEWLGGFERFVSGAGEIVQLIRVPLWMRGERREEDILGHFSPRNPLPCFQIKYV